MSDDRCPKCGAGETSDRCGTGHLYRCGSEGSATSCPARFFQSSLCRIAELEQELARRRNNTILGLRAIGEPEDGPEPEFTLAVLAAGLKVELELARKNLRCPDDRLLSQWLVVREPPVYATTFKAKGGVT